MPRSSDSRVFISAQGVVAPFTCGVDALRSAYEQQKCGFGESKNFFSVPIQIPYVGLIPMNRDGQGRAGPDLVYREKFDYTLQLLMDQLKTQVHNLNRIDAVWIVFGTSEYRGTWDRHRSWFSLGQDHVESAIINSLSRQGITLNSQSEVYFTDHVCASSTVAMAECFRRIRGGAWQSALVLSMDFITYPVLHGLDLLGALNRKVYEGGPEKSSRPFSASRQGFVRNEVGGLMLLQNEDVLDSSRMPLLEIRGSGMSVDGGHVTAGCPEGLGIEQSMRAALTDARLSPDEIDLVKAHGTGTRYNDLHEASAVRRVFEKTPVFALKGQFGHAAGSSGLLEAILCGFVMEFGKVFPSWNSEDFDTELGVNLIRDQLRQFPVNKVLMNSCAFGGHNSSLIMSRFNS